MSTLIIPCAGRSTRFTGTRPKWLWTHPDGQLMIQKCIEQFKVDDIDRIIITIVKPHCESHDVDIILKQALPNAEICILDDFTDSQPETTVKTIEKMNVTGPFITRDSDSYVKFRTDITRNMVVGVSLYDDNIINDITGKSFLIINNQNMVVDIIEKSVCSNTVSIGIYGFNSAEMFAVYYKELVCNSLKEVYPSHVISYMICNDNQFEYLKADYYEDWGTVEAWRKSVEKLKTYFIDIDGVLFKNKGQYDKNNIWNSESEPIQENIKFIRRLWNNGSQIMLVTARPKENEEKLVALLNKFKIRYHLVIMGCNHSERVIINDYSTSNKYPSCSAINIPRDSSSLSELL